MRPFRRLRKKIEAHFLSAFYNEKEGYVRLALGEDFKPAPVQVLMNTFMIGLEFPFRERLFEDKIPVIAHFKASQLKHPLGYSAVPYNSPLPCEMWRNVHMNQHLGHEGKLARLAGNIPEVKRILTPYFQLFRIFGVAVETYNLAGCAGDESQTANWQAFSATAAATAIISGLCGIFHHGGGYSYEPADSREKIVLEHFHHCGKQLKITIRGSGKYAVIKFNGKPLTGTLQLPVDLSLKYSNEWVITRTNRLPIDPVLISTHGMPVRNVVSEKGMFAFTADRSGAFPVKLLGAEKCRTYVNGKRTDCGPFHDLTVRIGDRLEFRMK